MSVGVILLILLLVLAVWWLLSLDSSSSGSSSSIHSDIYHTINDAEDSMRQASNDYLDKVRKIK